MLMSALRPSNSRLLIMTANRQRLPQQRQLFARGSIACQSQQRLYNYHALEAVLLQQQHRQTALASGAASTPKELPEDSGSVWSATAFLGLLLGANCLAIWCEVNNPNQSYLQDLGTLGKRRRSLQENDDGSAAIVEFDEASACHHDGKLHPRYKKRFASKLFHWQWNK
ncbi:hypothetical protein MPSEU_000043700 [Mayamaea pseudoterrestris]|nr:hypothetical protein MPSEU_000043700 [Mayamaea pseudoterrestris]